MDSKTTRAKDNIFTSLQNIKKFLCHLNACGLGPAERHSVKILDGLMYSFLHKAMPSDQKEEKSIKKLIEIVLQMKPILNIEMTVRLCFFREVIFHTLFVTELTYF